MPTSTPSDEGRGHAYGVEVHVQLRPTRANAPSGWLAYTYGVAAREAYGRQYPFAYDRRHALSIVAQAALSRQLTLAGTARLASGVPRTPAAGARVASARDTDDHDGDGNREELVPDVDAAGDLLFIQDFGGVANLNTARLPTYARLDARLTLKPRGPNGRFAVYLDVINVLGRQNPGFIRSYLAPDPGSDRPRLVEERSLWLPVLPSVGARLRF